ncbi:amino acid ABC transporter permease [Mesorhizobium sp. BH1-1-5]|uniref:amino acid ABC transporter permease n=1 Tax=unclassified Mesorhizobium TaxID=325217 RepID=UPI001AEEC5F8|nr:MULTISPECIES: amino acid ABC transporter permease [unclassified Mesorhizobium]MBZ9989322.1 amino acid ABC transporter permease [Mesorhizobium sp. BH1-1-5]
MKTTISQDIRDPAFLSGKPKPLGRGKRAIVTAVVVALVLALALRIVASGAINWPITFGFFFHPAILDGLVMTLELTALSMIVGVLLGVALAVMAISRYPAVSAASALYVWIFRGTPLLVQLIFWFNIALVFPVVGIGAWQVSINSLVTPFAAALLGLGLNEAAYMAEIVRAGIKSVDSGQGEAAVSVGLNRRQVMNSVILPQALKVIIPPTANQTIGMLKNTSLVSVIGAQELLTKTEDIYARNFQVIELLIVASLWYLVLTTVASAFQFWLERRFGDSRAVEVIAGVQP